MDFASQLSNSISYSLHSATYNPEAEEYAKKQEKETKEKQAKEEAEKKAKEEAAKKAQAAADEKAKKEAEEARKTFSISRLVGRVFKYTFYAMIIVGLVLMSVASASYAVNLNLYRPWYQRLFYAVYGFFFSFLSFPYIVLYRRWWLGHTLPNYGILPLFEREEASGFVQSFLPFLTFVADEHVNDTMEWESFSGQASPGQEGSKSQSQTDAQPDAQKKGDEAATVPAAPAVSGTSV
jgi:hypothetical protein